MLAVSHQHGQQVTHCTSGPLGPFPLTLTLVFVDEGQEGTTTLATEFEDDYARWVAAMTVHSHVLKHAVALQDGRSLSVNY